MSLATLLPEDSQVFSSTTCILRVSPPRPPEPNTCTTEDVKEVSATAISTRAGSPDYIATLPGCDYLSVINSKIREIENTYNDIHNDCPTEEKFKYFIRMACLLNDCLSLCLESQCCDTSVTLKNALQQFKELIDVLLINYREVSGMSVIVLHIYYDVMMDALEALSLCTQNRDTTLLHLKKTNFQTGKFVGVLDVLRDYMECTSGMYM